MTPWRRAVRDPSRMSQVLEDEAARGCARLFVLDGFRVRGPEALDRLES